MRNSHTNVWYSTTKNDCTSFIYKPAGFCTLRPAGMPAAARLPQGYTLQAQADKPVPGETNVTKKKKKKKGDRANESNDRRQRRCHHL